jgi:hypothetical protein
MDNVRAAVFRPLAWDGPGELIDIELAPRGMRQLIATLSRQQQQLGQRAEGPADAVAGEPERANLLVVECALTLYFLRRHLDTICRVLRDQTFVDCPPEHCLQVGQGMVRLRRRILGDAADQPLDFVSGDLAEQPVAKP